MTDKDDARGLLRDGVEKGYINHTCLCEAWDGYACDCGLVEYQSRITAHLAAPAPEPAVEIMRDCICCDPENCTQPVPGYKCRRSKND